MLILNHSLRNHSFKNNFKFLGSVSDKIKIKNKRSDQMFKNELKVLYINQFVFLREYCW